jgi:hypothetical protein
VANDDDNDPLRGFAEANTAFERLTKVKMMDDAALLESYRALSYQHVVNRTAWLELIEAEVRARGLASEN